MQRITLILLISLMCFSLKSFAQTNEGLVKGKIINATNNEAFANVNVALYSMPDTILVTGTASKVDGSFTIEKVSWGDYLMVIKYIGFAPQLRTFSLSSSSSVYDTGDLILAEVAQE